MISIRPAVPADAAAMSAVLTASIRDLCTADHRDDAEILAGWLRNKTPEMVLKMLERPGALFLVAEHDGEIAAVGCLTGADEIGLNYVAPLTASLASARPCWPRSSSASASPAPAMPSSPALAPPTASTSPMAGRMPAPPKPTAACCATRWRSGSRGAPLPVISAALPPT